ncbi:MAG: MerR family transcriptional regulator [Acutalibacteraceae bacterium]|nr:MerR family transcriptional regulator [Acutalibacteraceae bacterium]
MKMHIKEFAALTNVSVRTLHYYDEIGLLKPCFVDEQNGYRYYDKNSLLRMQQILFYRELDFPLKSINEILSSPNYDKQKALSEQKRLLILKKQRLERLIDALDNAEKGNEVMNMDLFDNSEYETARKEFEAEAKQKWGDTAAYKEYEQKSAAYTNKDFGEINAGLDSIMAQFAECMRSGASFADADAQTLVQRLQSYISAHFYSCTNDILSGLGEMYVADERFMANIDKHGSGTAEFISAAIKHYCKAE